MKRILGGLGRVLKPNGVAVLVIGDVVEPGKERVPLAAQVWRDLKVDSGLQLIEIVEDHLPVQSKVSRIWGESKGQATDKDCVLVLSLKGADVPSPRGEVDWDEPYKDGGPDAAHARLQRHA